MGKRLQTFMPAKTKRERKKKIKKEHQITLEFRGQVLALEQIHRDLLEIDPVHSATNAASKKISRFRTIQGGKASERKELAGVPAEDDYGPAGLRPAVGVHLEQRLHGGAAS